MNAAAPILDAAALAASAIVTVGGDHGSAGNPFSSAAGRFTPIHADALDDLPPVKWLFAREIPAQSLTAAYGATSSGKSFVCLNYALSVAQTQPVLYVAAEGAGGYAARKIAWCRHHRLGAGQLYFVGRAVNFMKDDEVDEFTEAITALRPVMVVLDTLARCMVSGDENSARDMGVFVSGCDRVRLATGATVLVVHHTGKSGLGERGSSALRAACDQMLGITNDDGLITLSCEKAKDAAEFEPRALRLLPVDTGRLTAEGTLERSCVVVPSDRILTAGVVTGKGRELLEMLAMETFREAGARSPTLIANVRMSSATLYKVLSALLRDGFIRQHEKGDPFYITEKGLAAIAAPANLGLPGINP